MARRARAADPTRTSLPPSPASGRDNGTAWTATRLQPRPEDSYELIEMIGEGGFGEAFLATRRHRSQTTTACVKLTDNRAAWHRECYFGELLRGNSRAVQVLDDFPVSDAEAIGGYRYALVTEYAENGSLADYLSVLPAPWPEPRIRREVRGILRALDQLHRGHAMHRDLTPMNVLVTGAGRLKVGDFGISTHAAGGKTVTADAFNPGFVPTAIAYGDEERWGAIDDVWQVGQLLAMLVRCEPEPIDTKSVKQLECSDELKAVIRRSIGSKSLRYPDAFALSKALEGGPAEERSNIRSLAGKNVVFTGKLWTRRADAVRLVGVAGGRVSKSVSRQTDVLVCGEPSPSYIANSKGMKRIEAETLNEHGANIAIINEAQFRRLVR